MPDFLSHLRTIHFSLVATCFALLVASQFTAQVKFSEALNQLEQIARVVESPAWKSMSERELLARVFSMSSPKSILEKEGIYRVEHTFIHEGQMIGDRSFGGWGCIPLRGLTTATFDFGYKIQFLHEFAVLWTEFALASQALTVAGPVEPIQVEAAIQDGSGEFEFADRGDTPELVTVGDVSVGRDKGYEWLQDFWQRDYAGSYHHSLNPDPSRIAWFGCNAIFGRPNLREETKTQYDESSARVSGDQISVPFCFVVDE